MPCKSKFSASQMSSLVLVAPTRGGSNASGRSSIINSLRSCTFSGIMIHKEDLKKKIMMPEYLRLAMKEAIQTKDVEAGTVTQLCEKAHARLIFQSRRWLFLLTPRAVGVMGLNSGPNFRNSWPKNRSLHTHIHERVFLVHTKCVYIMYTLCGLKYNCISNCNVYYAFFASSYYVCAVRACTCMQKLLRTFLHFLRRHDDK